MASAPTAPAPTFVGTVRAIHAAAGMRGFFAGLSPCLLRAFPSNACAFYVYEGLMRLMNAEKVRVLFGVDIHTHEANVLRSRRDIEGKKP